MGRKSNEEEGSQLLPPSNLKSDDQKSFISNFYAGFKVVLSVVYSRRGLLLVLVAALLNSVRSILSKTLIDKVHPLEVACVERVLMFTCCVPLLLWRGREYFIVGRSDLGLILLSGASHAFSVITLLLSYQRMDVGYVIAITSSRPAFVGVLGAICLREILSKVDIACSFITVIGLFLLARPLDLFLRGSINKSVIEGFLLALGSTLFAASNAIEKRAIGLNKIHTQTALCYNALISAFISGIACTIFREWRFPNDWLTGVLLLVLGCLGYLSNFCTFLSLCTETAFHVTTVGTIKIPFTFALQFFILMIPPDVYSLAGATFVVASSIGIACQSKEMQ